MESTGTLFQVRISVVVLLIMLCYNIVLLLLYFFNPQVLKNRNIRLNSTHQFCPPAVVGIVASRRIAWVLFTYIGIEEIQQHDILTRVRIITISKAKERAYTFHHVTEQIEY